MGTYIASVSPFEANLMTRIQAREDAAFQDLFDQFGNKIFRTALRILKEEQSAQDALQETFLNVFKAARHFRGDSKMGTWINRIAVNVCLEMLRKNRKHDARIDEDVSENTSLPDENLQTPFESCEQLEVRSRVQKALARIGRKHRVVVRMHDMEGYTIREIADILGVAEGTVKSRLFYGREQLKRQLTN